MLNDEEFVQESIDTNLYYLKSLRDFCLNVELSFPQNDQEYIDRAKEIVDGCQRVGEKLVNLANGRVSQTALDFQIYITDYSIPTEKLTEKLFGVDLAQEILKKEEEFTSGKDKNPSDEVINELEIINNESLDLVNKFIELSTDINEKLLNNELFSYTYPSLYEFMIYQCSTYKEQLERLIKRISIDPSYALDSEYYQNNSMKSIALFISILVDPQNEDIVSQANNFFKLFDQADETYKNTALTPENQKKLANQETLLVNDFHNFMQMCLERLIKAETYFIIEPTFINNLYTEINFLRYTLYSNSKYR